MTDALRYWALVELVGLLAVPVAGAFFSRLPGGGYALARPLGLLLVTYPVWLLASLRFVPYSAESAWGGLAFLAALAAGIVAWGRRQGPGALARLRERGARRLWLAGEALFTAAFAGWALMRSFAPDVWGTEKPMDMAFVNAINRSSWMPPHDPWLSGATINYYYYGHFVVAWTLRLTNVAPWVGFNLAVALFFALSAAAVFGVAAALYAAARERADAPAVSPIWPGLAAAALAMLLGNLDGALELLQNPAPLLTFDWWSPSRVIADTINEFPYFSFLLADLHAHMLAAPFGLTAFAFALQLALTGPGIDEREKAVRVRWVARWLPAVAGLLLAGLVVGSLYAFNGWDYPTELGIGFLALLLWASRRSAPPVSIRPIALWAACWLAVSFLLFLPFYLHFKAPEGGIGIVRQHPGLIQYLHDYLVIYGLSFWIVAAAVAARLRAGRFATRYVVWSGVAAAAGLALLAPTHLDGLALLLVACAFSLSAAADTENDQPFRVWWLIVGTAIGLATIGEVAYIRDAFVQTPDYRMNTIFKFGYQAWFLLAIAAGVGVFWSKRWMTAAARPLFLSGAVFLAGCAGVYTVAGAVAREGGFHSVPTLDGLRWLEAQAPGDALAIRWLNANVQGAPTILESVGGDYDAAGHGRISTFTGLPAVLGWPGHEAQWDHNQGSRQQDVQSIYTTTDVTVARALLQRYGVSYVIVGSLERTDFPPTGLAKFAQLGTVVYSADGTIIYRVGR